MISAIQLCTLEENINNTCLFGSINQTIPFFFVSMSSLQFFILISLFYKYENSMLYKKSVVSALYHLVPEKIGII